MRSDKYDLIALVVLALAFATANLLWTAHEVNVNNTRQVAEQRRVAAAQRKAGILIEEKICSDVQTMAALNPPAGAASANPSRAYEQAEHRAWLGLVVAIGCKENQ